MNEEKKFNPTEEVIEHEVDKKRNKAEDYLHDPEKSKQLLDEALKKAKYKEARKGPLEDVWNSLQALLRMFQAYIRKDYTVLPWGSIVLVVVAILYFVSPFDLLPDWIPLAGFVDDAAIIGFVLRQINNDLDAFLKWEGIKRSLETVINHPPEA